VDIRRYTRTRLPYLLRVNVYMERCALNRFIAFVLHCKGNAGMFSRLLSQYSTMPMLLSTADLALRLTYLKISENLLPEKMTNSYTDVALRAQT